MTDYPQTFSNNQEFDLQSYKMHFSRISLIALLGSFASAQEWQSIAASAESLGNSYATEYATSANSIAASAQSMGSSVASSYTASTASAGGESPQ